MQRGDEATGLHKLCQYGTTTGKTTLSSPLILAQEELQNSSCSLQGTEARPRACLDSALVSHLQAPTNVNIQTPDRGSGKNRCLHGVLSGPHEQSVLPRKVVCKKEQEYSHQYLGDGDSVDSLSKVSEIIEGEDCLLPDKQHNSSSLSVEGGWHSLQDPKWSCEEDYAQVPQEGDSGVPRIPQRCGKSLGRCPIQGQESSGV